MSAINVLFGTESGNAELVADDISDTLNEAGVKAEVVAMENFAVTDLVHANTIIVITSTYGEGELPETTAPFRQALLDENPDLSHLRFAAFGLGDSSYDTYNNAISILAGCLSDLGASRIGEIGRHDAVSGDSFTDIAVEWTKSIIPAL
ncbi:putative FMN-binding protein [Gordonia polyisoprenivorans NBRC 16320 = JCM 10675]|uniref:Nitric oxide synthase n=1 Tax=Gordonia polyisoprenivorans TaxID=84595 RepID=A0A846WSK3_9ACTN|nr:flavodoxin domain-containing protein [Gordonia polyisoprenivorans]NKY03916.1 nitric oxide synthase [Gordonia polyisoprenivorans]GAB24227.1 putative FMN-binding protein [Gordonia polyisoprenivorans NBRC 16320 = JCM 10675]